jgi:uncharacterized protein YggE
MRGPALRSSLLALWLLPPALAAAQAKPPTVTVAAAGSVQAPPDTAVVQFQIAGQNADVKAAYAQAERQGADLRARLRELGFAPQQAHWSQYAVTPNWDYQTHRVTSYSVTAAVQLLLSDFERIAPLMNAFSGGGSTVLRGVSFELRHSDAARRQAIAAAYARAHVQAEAFAAAAGLKLGRLVSATVNAGGGVAPQPRLMAAQMASAPVAQLTPQTLDVAANVTVVYELERP